MSCTFHRNLNTVLAATVAVLALAAFPLAAGEAETQAILERFVDDYRNDVMARNGTFGVRIDGEWWHVTTTGVEPGGTPESVTLHRGQPEEPTWFFWSDFATLERLDKGTMNAGTAMVKAFSTDVTPMDVDAMEGFQPDEGFLDRMLKATFHFWVRGMPEIVPFSDAHTRPSHGADAVVLYYQPGLRSGWFSIKKGQHANEDPRMQTNPFPSMLIGTERRLHGEDRRQGGRPRGGQYAVHSTRGDARVLERQRGAVSRRAADVR